MKIAYIRWRDAKSEEAVEPGRIARAGLCELQSVGFLLSENDEAVLIGMELDSEGEVEPGRWRFHVPRALIEEMIVIEMTTFHKPPNKKRRKMASITEGRKTS